MLDNLLLDFIQIAIGAKDSLSVAVTNKEWLRIYTFCKRQSLLGIGFTAVEKLYRQGIECPKTLRTKWMALALQIEKRNEVLNGQCRVLSEQYEHDGLQYCILKGQGNLLNYPEILNRRRTPGDIDVWTVTGSNGIPIAVQTGKNTADYITYYGKKGVIEYVKMQHRLSGSKTNPIIRYHHIEAPNMDDTSVEIHFRVGHINSPLRNRRMQRWFDQQADVCMKNKTQMGFSVPTASVNVVYQMTHIFSHFFDEGIGLRQLMDYYFALKLWHNDCMEQKNLQSQGMWSEGLGTPVMSKVEVMAVLRSFGMAKFAAAVMYVLHKVFAMPTHYYICEPNEKEGRKLLAEIMQGGNFGQYDKRDRNMRNGGFIPHAIWKLKRVMRLVSSYPEEALCEPFFRVWHWGWRCLH